MSLTFSFNALSYSNRSLLFLGTDSEIIPDNNLYLSLVEKNGKTSLYYKTKMPTGKIECVELANKDIDQHDLVRIMSAVREENLQLLSNEDKDSILKVALKNGHILHDNRPISVMVTIGWEYLSAGGDNYFMTIENMNNLFIYSNLNDQRLSIGGKYNYIAFVRVLKDHHIYIPFEIYKYFNDDTLCSGEGIFRFEKNRKLIPEISILAQQCYPGQEGIERYYEYFDNFNKGLSKKAPPLTHSAAEAMADMYFEEDFFNFSEEHDISSLDDSSTSASADVDLPRKQILRETLDKKTKEGLKKCSLERWQAIFKELESIIETSYLDEVLAQEAAFIYQAQLFVNNANYSVDEKLKLHLPSSPLQNQEKNLYLRTDKNFPIFQKSKSKIFKIPTESIFINVGIELLESTLKNYCNIYRISSVDDIRHIEGIGEEYVASFVCILIDDSSSLNEDLFENAYHIICEKTNLALEKVKEKYIICQIKKLENVYALIYPGGSKELRDRLNILTSLGHVPDLVTFYRSLFHFFKNTLKNPNANIFAELFKALDFVSSFKVEKLKPSEEVDISEIFADDSTHTTYFHQYIKNIRENLRITEVCQNTGEIGKFIERHFCKAFLKMNQADNLDDFIFEFQAMLELLLLVIDIRAINIDLSEILKAKIEISHISGSMKKRVGESFHSDEKTVQEQSTFIGLSFQSIPMDGHCLFNAVGIYLGEDVIHLRNIVTAYMEANRDALRPFYSGTEEDFARHIELIRTTNEWGDNLEIHVLQQLFNRPIIILRPDANPTIPENLDELPGEPIFVYYNGHNHYDSFTLEAGFEAREILKNIQNAITQDRRVYFNNKRNSSANPLDSAWGHISIPNFTAYMCNYGMSAFTNIINALFDSFENCTIEIFNQGYFEILNNMDNLRHTVKRIKYTDDISTESSIVFIDMHPNNAVEKELYSHNVRKIFDRLYPDYKNRVKDSPGIYKTKKLIVIDATVNIMFDNELADIIKEAEPLVEAGLIDLIIVQSLTKFHQLSVDKFSAGILYLMNNNSAYWKLFNERLNYYCVASQPDRIVSTYFALFCEFGSEALMRNHDKINENTRVLYNLVKDKLAQFTYSKNDFLMEMTSSIDDGSSYISFNYRKLTGYMYQTKFISDKHISSINKEIIKFIVKLSGIEGIQLTQRQSIGFGVCNIGECDFAIRLTVGLEQVNDLQKLANILTYVCYALITGVSQIESTEDLNAYLIKVEDIFKFLTIEESSPNKSPMIPLGCLDISNLKSKADILLRDTHDAKKRLIGAVENKEFDVYTTYLSKKGEPKRKIFSELPMLMKLTLCLFIMNNQDTTCKIVFNNTSVLDIPNFINVRVDNRSEFTYSSDQYSLLHFILIGNRLSVLNKQGQTILTGDDVDIHRDVLENFGVSLKERQIPISSYSPEDIEEIEQDGWQSFLRTNLYKAEQCETAPNYATFSSLPLNIQHQLFDKLRTTTMIFTNGIDRYSKKSVPVKISIESKNYSIGNGFHLERFKERDTTEYHLSIFSIKPPILNLFCQYVCFISVYAFLNSVCSQRDNDFNFIFVMNKVINESEIISRFSTIIQLFLKHNREIRKIVENTSVDDPDRLKNELYVLRKILLFLKDYYTPFKIISDEQNLEAKRAENFFIQLLKNKYVQIQEPEKLSNKSETTQDEVSVADDQGLNTHVELVTIETASDLNRKLFEAARDGRLQDVIALINHGANINSQHDDSHFENDGQYGGKTSLFIAAEMGHSHVVEALIEYGADINIRDNGHWSPYDVALVMEHQKGRSTCSRCVVALKNRHFFEAAYRGDIAATIYWLNQGTNINSRHTDRRIQPNGDTYAYREKTALFIAAEMGHHALVKLLLENGANPKMRDAGFWRPYDVALVMEHKTEKERITLFTGAEYRKECRSETHYETAGSGQCFFHAAFGVRNQDDIYVVENSQLLRDKWCSFMDSFASVAEMPIMLQKLVEAVLEHFYESTEFAPREMNSAHILILREQVKARISEATVLTKNLVHSLQAEILQGNIKLLLIMLAEIINHRPADDQIRISLRELLKLEAIGIVEIDQMRLALTTDQSLQKSITEILMNNQQYIENRIRGEIKMFARFYNSALYTDEYFNQNFVIEEIKKQFLHDQTVYAAYAAAIKQASYYVFMEEIPILATLSKTTIRLWYREQQEYFKYDDYIPNQTLLQWLADNRQVISDELAWSNASEVSIFHNGVTMTGAAAGFHYSRANEAYLQLQLLKGAAESSQLSTRTKISVKII